MREIREIYKNFKKIGFLLFDVGKRYVFLIWLLILISALIPTCSTLIMQKMINCLQIQNVYFVQVVQLFILYVLCDVINSLMAIWSNYLSMIVQHKLTLNINELIIKKIKKLELQNFETTESYNKLQRAKTQSGMQMFNYFFHIVNVVRHIVVILGAGFILSSWEIWPIILISVISVINMLLLLRINKFQYQIIRERTGEEREKWYYEYVLTNDIAFKEIKAYNLHDFFEEKYIKIAKKFLKQDISVSKKNALVGVIKTALEQISNILVLGKILRDTYMKKIMIGNTMSYIKVISNIKGGINGIFFEIANIYKESLYISQTFEFLEMEIIDNNIDKTIIETIDEIKLVNVSYRYRYSKTYAVKNINLTIHRGDKLILVGENGCGKSTLIKIIAGFYDDYEGDIRINEIDFRNVDKNSYRKRLGILFQDYNKYEMKVRENVGVGNLEMLKCDSKIIDSLIKANAPKKLLNVDMQLGYWFNDGCQLSGGEWLRLALSRIFMRNADLYILDEPNASLDPIGESRILSSINHVLDNKTCLVVTHHINNIEKILGNIIMLKEGKIVGIGSHNEMMKNNGYYREMYQKSVETKAELND